MDKKVDIEELERLEAAILGNKNLSSALSKPHIFPQAHKRISEIFSSLEKSERSLFISLISRYEIHTEYDTLSFHLIEWMFLSVKEFGSIVISTPYVDSVKEQKSSGLIAYELKSQLIGLGATRKSIIVHDIVPSTPVDRPIFIVDDFSGSGQTIQDAIARLIEVGQPEGLIRVAVLYAMDAALGRFVGAGIEARAVHSAKPCLTGHNYGGELGGVDAGATYDGIESRLGVSVGYRRGYGAAESLVSMKRTPNNTLPIFWFSGKGKLSWPCPFPR